MYQSSTDFPAAGNGGDCCEVGDRKGGVATGVRRYRCHNLVRLRQGGDHSGRTARQKLEGCRAHGRFAFLRRWQWSLTRQLRSGAVVGPAEETRCDEIGDASSISPAVLFTLFDFTSLI